MLKSSYSKPVARKAVSKKTYSSKPSTRQATKTYTKKVPFTTNIGTRPPSVMPGQPGVPTGGTKVVNKAAALAQPARVTSRISPGSPAAKVAAIAKAAATAKRTVGNLGTRLVAGPSTPQITPTTRQAYVKTPAPTSRPTGYVKTAPTSVRPTRTNMNHPTEFGRTGGGGRTSSGGGGGTTRPTAVTPSVTPTTATTATPTPTAPVVKPPVTGNTNPTSGFSSLRGRNVTAGQFNRRRLGRGPIANESLTPEELRRIAAQKVNNYG